MINHKWTATKKEFTFDTEGKKIPDKITYEKVQRNWLDLIVKVLGAFAIFIPLLLIYLQKNIEINLEIARNRSELYTGVVSDLQIIVDQYGYTTKFESAVQNIRFKYTPNVYLIKDKQLNSIYLSIVTASQRQDFLLYYVHVVDSVFKERRKKIDNAIEITGYVPRDNFKKLNTAIVREKQADKLLIASIDEIIDGVQTIQSYGRDDRERSGEKYYVDTLLRVTNRSISEMIYLKKYLELKDKKSKSDFLEYRFQNKPGGDIGELIYYTSKAARNNANTIKDLKKKFEYILLELL